MADDVVARSRLGDIEDRLGIDRLDVLLADRYKLVEKVATLRARYGNFGTFEHLRKVMLATVKMKARAESLRDPKAPKPTEGSLDDLAHSAPEYVEFVTQATLDRSELTLLEAKIEAIDATIMRANAITRFAASEARL